MGSESCAGVGVKEYRSGAVSVDFDSSASFSRHNETPWNKMPNGEDFKNSVEKSDKELNFMSTSSHVPLLDLDAKRQRRTSGKAARKSRLSQLEACMNETETNDVEDKAKQVGFFYGKGIGLEKTQTSRQKTNINGKRGDKRNGKTPKNKNDSFSVKSGLASFSSAAVGNNILGGYGLRAELEDVTKNVDELSLNELLEGSYKCPKFAADKGERSADPNEKIMQSVKDAWSILQTRKVKPQVVEVEGSYHQEVLSPCYLAMDSLVASRNEGANVDTNIIDDSAVHKVQDSEIIFKAPTNILDFPLYEPGKILERIALPPPKDLEFLLLDAGKSSTPRSADTRSGKPANQRGCLPPFSWSNAYSGHCKSNADAIKLSTSKTTCQGRWAKIETTFTSPDTTSGFLKELESLRYDASIVPVEYQTLAPLVKQKDRPESVSITGQGLITCPVDPQASQAVRSPRALAAAQLLCDIAAHSSKKNGHGVLNSPKRPFQKSMRAPYSKPSDKLETIYVTPTSKSRFDCPASTPDVVFALKRPRPSVKDKSAEPVPNNIIPRGQLPSWSMPRSNRSSPNKSLRGSVSEVKPYDVVKKSYMSPPVTRTVETSSSSQPKQRKLMRIGWNRESGKMH